MDASIQVFYSPEPDEKSDSSASCEYAKRASQILSKECRMHVDVEPLSIESLNNGSDDSDRASPKCTFVIISCSADGSVNRTVRKILRRLKQSKTDANPAASESSSSEMQAHEFIAIALLGHARCENSANQMKDTIFNFGRKFHRCVESASTKSTVLEKIEVQVELEGPDLPGGFDEWVKKNAVVFVTTKS